jgi:predicted transcriptional regulator
MNSYTMKKTIFWDVTRCNEEAPPAARLVYSSNLKTEAVRSSEILLNFYQTFLRHFPESNLFIKQAVVSKANLNISAFKSVYIHKMKLNNLNLRTTHSNLLLS